MHKDEYTVAQHGTLKAYLLGFILSILLTLAAYFLVVEQTYARHVVVALLIGLSIMQAFVQLVYFLHLGNETKPRWNLLALLFMIMIVVILVFGSLWIMSNLDYNVMPQMTMETYMHDHEGI